MATVSRRSFAFGCAAALASIKTQPIFAQTLTHSAPPAAHGEGIFNLYVSEERAVMMVRSAGGTPLPVIFDTGSNGNALDIKTVEAQRLAVVPDHINRVVDGATGASFDTHDYILPAITIGTLNIGDRQITGYPFANDDLVGIFGPSLFTGHLVYVDVGASRVRLINKRSFGAIAHPAIPYLGNSGDGLPAVHLTLPAKAGMSTPTRIQAKLDSGNNSALHLPPAYIDSVPLMQPPAIVGRTTSVSGSHDVLGGRIRGAVTIGSAELHDLDVIFDGITANVGLPVIRKLRFILDPATETGWLITPISMPVNQLHHYAGQYGTRRIAVIHDQLVYQRAGAGDMPLIPLGNGLFDIGATPAQIQFGSEGERISRLTLITPNNQMIALPRTA